MVARLWLPAAFAIVSPIVCALPVGFQQTLTPESAVFSISATVTVYGATHAKLAALPSLPGAPVNFGHFGHSHNGRERFALGFPSIAVRPAGACPCSTHACSAVRLSIFALNGPKPWPKPGIM